MTLFQWLGSNFDLLFAFFIAWFLFLLIASIVYRKVRRKKVLIPARHEVVFEERGASGRSLRTWWTRLGGAYNCLVVSVTRSRLVVRPIFPFTLLFLPEVYDLEHSIGLTEITNINIQSGVFRQLAVVEFQEGQQLRRIEFTLRDSDGFLQSIGN